MRPSHNNIDYLYVGCSFVTVCMGMCVWEYVVRVIKWLYNIFYVFVSGNLVECFFEGRVWLFIGIFWQ